jgi:hypothetical protein
MSENANSDLTAAFSLVEKLRGDGWRVLIRSDVGIGGSFVWTVEFWGPPSDPRKRFAYAEELPEAIRRAADMEAQA